MSVKTYDLKDVKISIAGIPVKGWVSEGIIWFDARPGAFEDFSITGTPVTERAVDPNKEND